MTSTFNIRQATPSDAIGMNAVLSPILESWGSDRPRGADYVLAHYIEKPDRLSCVVAVSESGILGFQTLKRADADNIYDVPVGWGVIGTYAQLGAARKGIGRAMFAETCKQARAHGIMTIDATIGSDNTKGLAYYEAMGFRIYDNVPGAIRKVLRLTPNDGSV